VKVERERVAVTVTPSVEKEVNSAPRSEDSNPIL